MTLPRFASYERVTVSLGGRTEADSVIAVSCDADWLSLTTTILPADGIVSLATTDNTGQQRRTATLTFAAADGRMATASVSSARRTMTRTATHARMATWATDTTSIKASTIP